jgi:hypothetical protein
MKSATYSFNGKNEAQCEFKINFNDREKNGLHALIRQWHVHMNELELKLMKRVKHT